MAKAQVPLADVEVVIREDPFRYIPEWGIGGFAPDAQTVLVNVAAARVDEQMLTVRLPATVAHELHHAARWLDPGYGLTLFDLMITEGLADHFACELLGQTPPPWATALTDDQIPAVKAIAAPELDPSTHNHPAWFYGAHRRAKNSFGSCHKFLVCGVMVGVELSSRTRRSVGGPMTVGGPMADLDAELVCRLYGALRRFAAVVGSWEMEPDDLVQEALERALRVHSLCQFDDPLSYLRRAMLNIASNARRSSGRRHRALTRLVGSPHPVPESYPSDLGILDSLAPEIRAVLYLAEVERWTYAEIALLLGCTPDAARTRAARGRRALRSVLEAGDD